jgi:hypothetical protein
MIQKFTYADIKRAAHSCSQGQKHQRKQCAPHHDENFHLFDHLALLCKELPKMDDGKNPPAEKFPLEDTERRIRKTLKEKLESTGERVSRY